MTAALPSMVAVVVGDTTLTPTEPPTPTAPPSAAPPVTKVASPVLFARTATESVAVMLPPEIRAAVVPVRV